MLFHWVFPDIPFYTNPLVIGLFIICFQLHHLSNRIISEFPTIYKESTWIK